jgi:hypothetical protein
MLEEMEQFGRALILIGVVLLCAGLLFAFGGRLPLRLGRLPGDFVIRGKHSVFYFPLGTSIVISLLLSVVFWLASRR